MKGKGALQLEQRTKSHFSLNEVADVMEANEADIEEKLEKK